MSKDLLDVSGEEKKDDPKLKLKDQRKEEDPYPQWASDRDLSVNRNTRSV